MCKASTNYKSIPTLKKLKLYNGRTPMATHNITRPIQMKRKELRHLAYDPFKLKNPFGLHGLYTNISAL